MAGIALKGLGYAFRAARGGMSLPGIAAIGIGDEIAFDGAGRNALGGFVAGEATEALRNSTGLNSENIDKAVEDFKAGDWAGLASNPLMVAAAGVATAALQLGTGKGAMSAIFTGLLVAGIAYIAQKHLLADEFGAAAPEAGAPAAPAPVVAAPTAPEAVISAPAPGMQ